MPDEMEKPEVPDTPIEDSSVPDSESILNSVKKMLGIDSTINSFDVDIIININSAIGTLTQLGIGPKDGFFITDESQTYSDYLGDLENKYHQVKMYLYLKTRVGFDPPSSSYVLDSMNKQIAEFEWRMKTLSEEVRFQNESDLSSASRNPRNEMGNP